MTKNDISAFMVSNKDIKSFQLEISKRIDGPPPVIQNKILDSALLKTIDAVDEEDDLRPSDNHFKVKVEEEEKKSMDTSKRSAAKSKMMQIPEESKRYDDEEELGFPPDLIQKTTSENILNIMNEK